MEGTLKVTPEQLRATSSDFQSKGQQVSSLTTEMMDLVTSLSSAWEGDASNAYINKFKELSDDIQRMIAMITEHTNDLNDMAASYDEAERRNVEAAQTLSGDVIV
ncbi:MAG: WXG100 family type VII secretion target [Lachnospira sp.]|nr:WXG100 family type VII secretion target [Lachnospira sp.]